MKVRLIENPWCSDDGKFPEGLTLNAVYNVVDEFDVNTGGDSYYVILDDFGKQQGWNKLSFEIVED